MCVQANKKHVSLNWQIPLDRANFYMYVPVYISTTPLALGGIQQCSPALLLSHREKVQLHLLTRTMYHQMFVLFFFLLFCFGLVSVVFQPLRNIRGACVCVYVLVRVFSPTKQVIKNIFLLISQSLSSLTFWSLWQFV